jgi:hypothetical protein
MRQFYPFQTRLSTRIMTHALIGGFIALFLIVFQPFETDNWENSHKNMILAGYGAVTFLVLLGMDMALWWYPGFQRLEIGWRVWMEILYHVTCLLLITLGNAWYASWVGITVFSPKMYFLWLGMVLPIGFFPIVGLLLFRYNYYKAINQKTATKMETALHDFQAQHAEEPAAGTLTLLAENERDQLVLSLDDLWYIESADNYAVVVHREGERLRKSTLRGSLRRLEEQLAPAGVVIRCHRSYLVNLQKVDSVSGNAQGYRLTLYQFGVEVPVSRQYGASVLARL